MAIKAENISVPGYYKLTGQNHLQGGVTKILANPEALLSYTVRRRNCITKQFSGICNWLI